MTCTVSALKSSIHGSKCSLDFCTIWLALDCIIFVSDFNEDVGLIGNI